MVKRTQLKRMLRTKRRHAELQIQYITECTDHVKKHRQEGLFQPLTQQTLRFYEATQDIYLTLH